MLRISHLWCIFLWQSATALRYFLDFAPWNHDYMLPYAIGYCQPGPKRGTYARYTCDVDDAGAYRIVCYFTFKIQQAYFIQST